MPGFRRLWKSAAAVAMAGGLALAGTSVASAAATAYNSETLWLEANPSDSMPTSCVQRRIDLAAGTYWWDQFVDDPGDFGTYVHIVRPDIVLGAGWYTWTDCLDPKNGHYIATTRLDPDNPSWAPVTDSFDWTGVPFHDGYTTWGSRLDPYF